MSDRIKGSALTMGGAACWGVSGCMGQYLFTREGMDSTWLVPIRLFLAGLILCGFFFIKDRKNRKIKYITKYTRAGLTRTPVRVYYSIMCKTI